METQVIKIDPLDPDEQIMSKIGHAIRDGRLVGFPTETVYGLAADAFNTQAVNRVFEVKGRPADKPLPVQVSDIRDIYRLAENVSGNVKHLIDCFFPGPLTIVLEASRNVSGTITAGTGKIGIRMPDHPVALSLLRNAKTPIVAPSANTSGYEPPVNADMLFDDLGGKIEYILDAGPTTIKIASTVVDVTEMPFRILREGSISEEMILECLNR